MPPPPQGASKKRGASSQVTAGAKKRRRIDLNKDYAQTTAKAFPNGDVTTSEFVKARANEIQAIEKAISAAKDKLASRAHQDLPRELRRRIASHDPKRVPKRLRRRARKEMLEDNTPLRKIKVTGKKRLRLETAKKLNELGKAAAKKSRKRTVDKDGAGDTIMAEATAGIKDNLGAEEKKQSRLKLQEDKGVVRTRKPKVKKSTLAEPPVPPKKFKKRQIDKTWLPTHMWHTKRAHMTEPKDPLWRFAIPMSPSLKSYRPTHRSGNLRGAVAWDMSYMSTIALEGVQRSMEGLLKALGVGEGGDSEDIWSHRGQKWRDGARAWEGWLFERQESPNKAIAPATILWCPITQLSQPLDYKAKPQRPMKRKIFIRVHPAGFLQLWEQVIRLAKVQKPEISVEDLRFEIGSIEITGPASTEALTTILKPVPSPNEAEDSNQPSAIWNSLCSLTNCSSLPKNAIIGFDCVDPRLRHPPRRPDAGQNAESLSRLTDILSTWPLDNSLKELNLFDRKHRGTATRSLPSQKSINRRKSTVKGKGYPEPRATDPKIPVLLYTTKNNIPNGQGTWTLMLPWKCVLPVWYSLMYYPVGSGGTLRFGGLQEKRQLAFESGTPWYPGDYPGVKAGFEWETKQREKRKREWEKMPKSKRVEWSTLDLGNGRRGEIGTGWACDWETLLKEPEVTEPPSVRHVPPRLASKVLRSGSEDNLKAGITPVKITFISRGVPVECARIYRLPTTDHELRKKWLAQESAHRDKVCFNTRSKTDCMNLLTLHPEIKGQKTLPPPQTR